MTDQPEETGVDPAPSEDAPEVAAEQWAPPTVGATPPPPLPPPPPFSAAEPPKKDQRFTPKRLAITFVVVLVAVVGGTLVANALTTNNSGSDQDMANWMSSYGPTYLAVSHDTEAVNEATTSSAVRAACVQLQGDVRTARSNPPMPLSSLQAQWSTIVSDLSTTANDCITGIDEQNRGLLDTAQNHMTDAGKAYLRLVRAVQQAQ